MIYDNDKISVVFVVVYRLYSNNNIRLSVYTYIIIHSKNTMITHQGGIKNRV